MSSPDQNFEFDNLSSGLTFATEEAAIKYINDWCDENFFPLIVRSSYKGNEKRNGQIKFFLSPWASKEKTGEG